MFRDLRYIRLNVPELASMVSFASDMFGLQVSEEGTSDAWLRSDARNYSLCFSETKSDAIAFSVATMEAFEAVERKLKSHGCTPDHLSDVEAAARECKAVLSVQAPNGVTIEVVWRPLTSGWRYHGPRDAGITGLAVAQMACKDIAADEAFWTKALGLTVTDWAGDAVYLSIDDQHHQVALYPSEQNRLLGASWSVESKDNIMQNWYAMQAAQVPVVAGPDRQAASQAMYVTFRSPTGFLMSYFAEMDQGDHIRTRGPRQFSNRSHSHGIWGAKPDVPEFRGDCDD